jgi:hypothetical protein
VSRNDVCGGFLMIIFGSLTTYLSLKMPIGTFRAAGPGLFPLCLGLLLMLLAVSFTLKIFMQNRQIHERQAATPKPGGSAKPVIGFMAVIGAAAVLLEYLGYAPTAFLMVLALLQILESKKWHWNLLIALSSAAVSHFVFVWWLQIPFPQGWLGL